MRVRKELEPEPWVGAESSWGKVVVVSNYAQASKPASQTQHRTCNQRGSLEQSSTNYLWALHSPFLRDFKRTCNSCPLTVQMLWLTNLVACYLLMPTEDWVPATRWLPVHQSNVIWSALNTFTHSLNTCIISCIFTLLMSIFSTFNSLIQWNISMLSINDCKKIE